MSRRSLVPHDTTPPAGIGAVEAEIRVAGRGEILLTFRVTGAETLLVPDRVPPRRADGLWKTTCFELFLRAEGSERYAEYNFSPSTEWAAYAFESYRNGMRDLPLAAEPRIEIGGDGHGFELNVRLDLSGQADVTLRAGLSAVIEETDGTKSYWALAHAPGKPDFHDPDCFVLELPAATRA